MKKVLRWIFYLVGMVVLAVGLTISTKTALGVSAIMSVPFCVSEIWGLNFGNVTLIVYVIFVLTQMILHGIAAKKRGQDKLGRRLALDALQFPLSLAFTRVINLVSGWVPMLTVAWPDGFLGSLAGRILVILLAVVLTGVGAAMTLNMRIVPNPADGIVQTLADFTGKPVGFTKNWFDALNVVVTLALGFAFGGGLVGVGIGTVIAALGVGRVIALFNRLWGDGMCRAAGLS